MAVNVERYRNWKQPHFIKRLHSKKCQFIIENVALTFVTNFLTGQSLGVPMNVFGTETHMTAIVGMALGKTPVPDHPPSDPGHTANFLLASSSNQNVSATTYTYFIEIV